MYLLWLFPIPLMTLEANRGQLNMLKFGVKLEAAQVLELERLLPYLYLARGMQ
jgi:hypothetical protein